MTTKTLTDRLTTPALTPTEQKAAQLADLCRRLLNGERIAAEAEAAGDWKRFERTMVKVHLRQIQIGFLEDRPDGAICPHCKYGDSGWSPRPVRRDEVWESCLDCTEDLHLSRARELAQRDVEGLV